ncbi:Bug family tripartite tricarboxylate transporter substrate binding protein [Bordetella genomosp. 12]|uniref:ABC transporter substrate-binding protein n=1 Tax=Bordetella genomosp. 12 TaxID=463035 RepID=A0A261VSJ8_9BORD|nr:tripartite tricarboxylate transporter substrate binding protein [Bordetella genomosp. 12]OZI77078.1 ABC transporter substrate-binding protein [Bordetella genomosp. 12]
MTAMRSMAAWLLSGCAVAGVAQAQDWPGGKAVTLVVPYTAGGSADALGRRLGDVLRHGSGVAVVIENKPGAGAGLGTDQVARAPADGATLLLAATSPLTILPHMRRLSYDPMRDLVPLASVAVAPVAIVATRSLRVDDFAQLVDFARRHPDTVRFGTPGAGTVAHMGMAALMAATGAQMTHVPYRGNSQALTDGLAGTVELLVVNSDTVLPHVASGALKPLAVMAPARLAVWPQVPTLAELELPQAQYYSNFGVFAPAGMPAGMMHSLQAALQRALADPEYQDLLAKSYLQPGTGVGSAFARQVREEYAANRGIIEANGIKAE